MIQSSLRYPSLYVHDGPDYLYLASMGNVIDNLIRTKKIRPIIGVFIPPGRDREGEYRLGKISQFTKLMVKELVPYIDSVYRTDARASERGTMGSSDGGHIALYLAVNYSDTFGLVGGQSSTITDLLREPVRTGPKIPVKFYLDVGTYDIYSTKLQISRVEPGVSRFTPQQRVHCNVRGVPRRAQLGKLARPHQRYLENILPVYFYRCESSQRRTQKYIIEIAQSLSFGHSIRSLPFQRAYYALLEGQKDFVLLETSRFDSGKKRRLFYSFILRQLFPSTVLRQMPLSFATRYLECEKSNL